MPNIEERESAIFNGYTWHEWLALERWERIYGTAHYRMHGLIELHKADAENREAERRQATSEARSR